MKTVCLLFTLLLSLSSLAQTNTDNRYSIQLPEEWQKKPKFLLKLTDIITSHIPALEKKQECLDCKADYTVTFALSPATVDYIYYHPNTSYDFTTIYHFQSFMDVFNKEGKLVHRLILNDSTAQHSMRKRHLYDRHANKHEQTYHTDTREFKATLSKQVEHITLLTKQFDSDGYIKDNHWKFVPSQQELWEQVERIIMTYKEEEENTSKN